MGLRFHNSNSTIILNGKNTTRKVPETREDR